MPVYRRLRLNLSLSLLPWLLSLSQFLRWLSLLLVFLCAGIPLCQASDASSATAVGFQHLSVPDPDGAPLELGIWYPTNAVPAAVEMRVATQTVAINGAVTGAALPLIVISHGTGGSYLSHHDTALALAQAGFIVAAVTHTGDNYADQSRSVLIMERPRHISRVLDYLLSDWNAHASIDHTRIGMFGFSAGGFTTLVSIGGQAAMERIAPFCTTHTADFACQLLARVSASGQPLPPEHPGGPDSRIRAAVVAAPALGYTFAGGGLKDVTVPVQLWRAEDDRVLPHPWYAAAVRAALPQPPEYHEVPLAGHFDFLAPCNAYLASHVAEICTSAPGFDRAQFHQTFNQAVVAFFVRTLPPH